MIRNPAYPLVPSPDRTNAGRKKVAVNRETIGKALTLVGGICGYLIVHRMVGYADCGVVSYGNPVPQCGIWDSLVFRFQNWLSMAGALLAALPGILLWLNAPDKAAENSEDETGS